MSPRFLSTFLGGREDHPGPVLRHEWLIRLRWWAIAGVLVTSLSAALLNWVLSPVPLFLVAGGMVFANFFFQHARLVSDELDSDQGEALPLALQIVCDLCALTLLLHFSGGLENPFFMFFAFHMAIGAMLLSRGQAYLMVVCAVLLFGGSVAAEFFGWIPHHHLALKLVGAGHDFHDFWRSPTYLMGFLTAFSLMLFGVVFFVRSVEVRRVAAERKVRERERVVLARERLARVGELSAGVAHSVRNPLHGVMNCISLLRQSLPPDDELNRETLAMMDEGLLRIEAVTKRLLHYGRRGVQEKEPTDIDSLVDDSIRFIDPRLDKAGVELVRDLANLPPVELDRDAFGEILINLLDNAIHATRGGGKVMVRSLLVEDADGRWVRLEVADNGVGIAPENLDKVFDPFFTTKEKEEGSGLGLALARRVVEDHGGRIRIDSRLGHGTVVRLELPAPEST